MNKTIAIGRAGDVRIGMPADSVYIIYDRTNVRATDLHYEGNPCPALEIYLPGGSKNFPSIVAEIGETPTKVWRIQVHDTMFCTANGIGPGSTFGNFKSNTQ